MKTNFEVYRKDLEYLQCGTDFGVNKTNLDVHHCDKMSCGDCLFNKAGYTCGQHRLKWLGSEYKKPIKLGLEERDLLEKISSTIYSEVQRKGCHLFFGTNTGNYTTYIPENQIALNLFKKELFSSLEEGKTYFIKGLLNGEE